MPFQLDFSEQMYTNRIKLSNGQFAQIGFQIFENDFRIDYYVVFAVATKKKDLRKFIETGEYTPIQLHSSGSCGLEALLWAKKQILEFEKFIQERKFETKTYRILIAGDDKRRFRVYKWAFEKEGYKLGRNEDNDIYIMKEI